MADASAHLQHHDQGPLRIWAKRPPYRFQDLGAKRLRFGSGVEGPGNPSVNPLSIPTKAATPSSISSHYAPTYPQHRKYLKKKKKRSYGSKTLLPEVV